MKKLTLDLRGLSKEDLRQYQEMIVSTIGQLKNGFFTAEAALGLHNSIGILGDLHLQVSAKAREIQDELDKLHITTEIVGE